MSGNAFPPRPHLTTPRLTLNALTPADCGDYAALCRDTRRNRWWGYDYREEQPHPPEEWFLQASEEDYAAGRELGLAVRLRGRCIGEVVFTHFDGRARRSWAAASLPPMPATATAPRHLPPLWRGA